MPAQGVAHHLEQIDRVRRRELGADLGRELGAQLIDRARSRGPVG
jgi:hypothetical protein